MKALVFTARVVDAEQPPVLDVHPIQTPFALVPERVLASLTVIVGDGLEREHDASS